MQPDQFGVQLRHLLANIHDYAVLERHVLNDIFPRSDTSISRAEHLRRTVAAAVELLKPQHLHFDISATEWRYYLILHGRYVEGANLAELQNQLALGDRQERRLHMRALTLLEAILWGQAVDGIMPRPIARMTSGIAAAGSGDAEDSSESEQDLEHAADQDDAAGFHLAPETLQLRRVIEEVVELCAPRIRACDVEVQLDLPADLPPIEADRIIVRQILLHLTNNVLLAWQAAAPAGGHLGRLEPIVIAAGRQSGALALTFTWPADLTQPTLRNLAEQAPLRYWLEQLNMRLTTDGYDLPASGLARLTLLLPIAGQVTLLVVDDHESAIRIIQRFLQRTAVRVVGETDPSRVPELVRMLHPQLLLLDVMMPNIDGWELLQRIKADPETRAVPVIVCSVWNVPELALSLGASDFLKKPIDAGHLLETLARLLPPEALPAPEGEIWPPG